MSESVERTVDHTFAAWVRRRSGSDILARAAFAASRDEGQGHSCAALDADSDFAALRAHAWVGDGAAFSPFVLTDAGDFYLWRNWRHETRLAEALGRRAVDRTVAVDTSADIDELFVGTDEASTRLQRAAVSAVAGKRLFVLTGGPGTGKTSTVLRMLLMLLRHAPSPPSIALAAPTGKAAQRMSQSIASGKDDLLRRLPDASPFRALLERVPHAQAQTLHRLLDYRAHENVFARGADSPLAADIVVVDETSMVDLATMRQLFDAVRDDATVILLGDAAQLYAVEAGSVLGDIVSAAERDGSPLAGHVVTLRHVWRAEQSLSRNLDRVRAGDADWIDEPEVVSSVRRLDCLDEKSLRARIDGWFDTHAEDFRFLLTADPDPAEALRRLRNFQILCALREGAFGANGINALLRETFEKRLGVDTSHEWHHGRPVIVTRNDYTRDLFNGDIGIALRGPEGLRVWFETRNRDGKAALRSLSTRTLPAHETAWAITIHRSQGSEYADVAVVLPPQADHRILSRELLYTAMSRASHRVELWTSGDSLRAAVSQPVQRRGGLRDRLARVPTS